jgi:hypothetical protein
MSEIRNKEKREQTDYRLARLRLTCSTLGDELLSFVAQHTRFLA